jgi:Holliday junction resolvasome RuvABC endonuclease subunit
VRVLSLDISTHTGYALFEGELGSKPTLVKYGQIENPGSIPEYYSLHFKYPFTLVMCASDMVNNITQVVAKTGPDVVVVEEINLGKQRISQKLLDSIHAFLCAKLYYIKCEVVYISSSEWRKTLNLRLSEEDKKRNKDVKAGKIKRGKINKKHLSVRLANAEFNLELRMKDNDIADAINEGYSYFLGAKPFEGE